MSLLIMVRFEDEEEALKFAEEHEAAMKGIYKSPTQYHFAHADSNHQKEGWSYNPKWGWWVCAGCRRPSSIAQRNLLSPGWHTSFGFNIIGRFFIEETSV